ncbi:MAG: hypothetical protein P9L94_14015 [Candidatus Hinthialibacter antarcticus]|nr:hypothetical protein [Candidatus Hinthialibacter antarcticus]
MEYMKTDIADDGVGCREGGMLTSELKNKTSNIFNLGRNQAGKGVIMRKSFAKSLTGVKSLFLFMLAIALLFGAGATTAQSLSFVELNTQYYKDGSVAGSAIKSGAVLVGNDDWRSTTGDQIGGTNKDGDLKLDSDAPKYLKNVVGLTWPIIANIQSSGGGVITNGEDYALMTVVRGVTPSIVTDVRASNKAGALALVSASFDKDLFSTTIGNSTQITAVSPTNVYAIGADTQGLPASVKVNSTTVLVYVWKNASVLQAENANKANAANSYKARVSIVNTTSATTSNFVGYETADSGPNVKTGVLVDGDNNIKTTIIRNAELFNGASLAAPAGKPSPTGVEFRTKDRLTVFTQVTVNASLDGEPNEYFSAAGDSLSKFNASTGAGTTSGGKGMSVLYDIDVQGGGQAINSASASSGTVIYTTQAAGSDVIVSITGVVRNDAQTTGANLPLQIVFTVADDIGNASSVTTSDFKIDTVAPIIVKMDAKTEGSIGSSYPTVYGKGKIGQNNPAADNVDFLVQIDPAGELVDSVANAIKWASIAISPTSTLKGPNVWTASAAQQTSSVTVAITQVLAAPDLNAANQIDAVSISADFSAGPNSATSSAFIVQVSDNARNFASQVNGSTQFITGGNTTFLRKSTSNTISAVTFTTENAAPIVLDATIYAVGLPDDFFTSANGDDTSFDKSALFQLLQSITEVISSASNVGLATDVRLVTHFGVRNATSGAKGMKIELEVAFSPDTSTSAGNDWRYSHDGNPSGGTSFFNAIFIGSATTADSTIYNSSVPAFVSSPTATMGSAGNPWTLKSAGFNEQMVNKATAIFQLTSGITSTVAFQASGGVANTTAIAVIADTNRNFTQPTGALTVARTNLFTIDAAPPIPAGNASASFAGAAIDMATTYDGKAAVASTVYFVTTGPIPSGFSIAASHAVLLTTGGVGSFENQKAAGAVSASFAAGHTLILSASFSKEHFANISTYTDADKSQDQLVRFPFVFATVNAAAGDDLIVDFETDTTKRLIGRQFGTISADFSEVITTSKNVIPDASSAVSGNVSSPGAGDVIYATWAFYVDPSKSINSSIGTNKVRYVTFTARDLAGNKEIFSFPLGKADFNVPTVSVARWDLARPNNSGGKDRGDIVGTKVGVTAASISAATISKSATSTVVVDFSNGPFDITPTTDTITLLLDNAGVSGNTNLLGSLIQPTSITNGKGTALVGGSTIGQATFVINWSSYGNITGLDVASAKLVATVTAVTGTVTQVASSNGAQVDGKVPTVVATLKEQTVLTGDSGTDIYVRPGRTLILTATVTTDSYEGSPSSAIGRFAASADFKNFSSPAVANIKVLTPATLGGGNTTYLYTYNYVVPSNNGVTAANAIVNVTDMAGNVSSNVTAQINGQNVRIETAVPTLDIVRLNATADYIRTGTAITTKTPIATTQINDVEAVMTGKGGAIIGGGDTIEYGVEITPNDPVFTDVTKFSFAADFSSIGLGNAVAPSQTSSFLAKMYATWSVTVPATATSIVNASFPITVKDPAATTGTGVTKFPKINVDTQVIPGAIALSKIEFWAGNKSLGSSPSALNTTPGNVTATVVVKAVFDNPLDAATLFKDQTVGRHFGNITGPTSVFEVVEVVGLDMTAFNDKAPFNDASGNGPSGQFDPPLSAGLANLVAGSSFTFEIYRAAADKALIVNDVNFAGAVTNSTAYILEATWAGIPITKNISSGASFVVGLTDSVGNKITKSLGTVVIDGQAPTITVTDLKVLSGTYLPAVKNATGTILAPTRVKSGALMQITLNVDDDPNDDIEGVLLKLDEFVSAGAEQLIAGVTMSTVGVTDTFTVGSSISTYTIDANAVKTGSKSFDNPFFYTVNSVSVANVVVNSTDTVGNVGSKSSTQLFEVDNAGPVLVDSRIFAITNDLGLPAIQSLTPSSTLLKKFNADGSFLQLGRSSWLVFAGTFVVDGSSASHFGAITSDVNAGDFIPDTIERFESTSITQGSTLIGGVNSATRSLRFATYAIQVKSAAPPILPENPTFTFVDALGNTTKRDDALIAIDAAGPRANDISLIVNGKADSIDNFANVGIGNTGPDLGTGSNFELAPSDQIIIVATMSTSGGSFPDVVHADLRAFYPQEVSSLVDQVLPTTIVLDDENDLVIAEWRYLTFAFGGLVYDRTTGGNPVRTAYQTFADLNFLDDNNLRLDSGTGNKVALASNAVISGATAQRPVKIYTGAWPAGSIAKATTIATNLVGLPWIQVQPDPKIADDVASITITVDVSSDNFSSSTSASSKFTVDTKRPVQVISMDPAQIVRNRTAKTLVTNTASNRLGYPLAQSQSNGVSTVPNRVRGGDVVPFIFNVTNHTIAGTKDDFFRMLPGTTFDPSKVFDINSAVANTIVVLTADVSRFATGMSNLQAGLDSSVAAYTASLVPSGSKNTIKAQINVTVSGANSGIGTTGTGSRTARSVTATVRDDSGNRPYDGYYTDSAKRTTAGLTSLDKVKKQLFQPVAVDNRAPTVSGELRVRLNSGSATKPNGDAVVLGELVPNNSKITPGAVLGVSATVIDTVDNPLDILNNINFGDPKMSGVNLADAQILLITQGVGLIGTDTIDVPFEVTLPPVGGGISSKNFSFTVSASDTIGNSQTITTVNQFQFDGDPALSLIVDGSVLATGATVNANASATTVISASAFDVGGVTEIAWISIPSVNGATITTTASTIGGEFGSVDLVIIPEVTSTLTGQVVAIASVTDISNNNKQVSVTIDFNQPSIFVEAFPGALTSSAGSALPAVSLDSTVSGYTPNAAEDVRSVTVYEGQTLVLDLSASDADNDAVIFAATGSAVDSSKFENSVISGTQFTFKPGYKAVVSASTEQDFKLDVSATDGKIAADLSSVDIKVVAQSATPTLSVQSIAINGVKATDPNALLQVDMFEEDTVEIVVKAVDAGDEPLNFLLLQQQQLGAIPAENIVVSGTSVLYATITYKPTLSQADVITLIMSAKNASIESNKAIRVLNIQNVSQAPIITAMISVDGAAAQSILANGSVTAFANQVINFTFDVDDPDGEAIRIPTAKAVGGAAGSSNAPGVATPISDSKFSLAFTVSVAANAAPGSVIEVIARATDTSTPTNKARKVSYFIHVPAGNVPVPAPYDEFVVAQGVGGRTNVTYRNLDPTVDANGDSLIDAFDLAAIVGSWDAMPVNFEANVGGGTDRAVYFAKGDVTGDGKTELVTTFGPVSATANANSSNMVVIRKATGYVPLPPIGNVFPDQAGSDARILYPTGELRPVVGDFIGAGTKQIAFAQGTGSTGALRLFQWNGGLDFANGTANYDIKAQLANQDELDADSGWIMTDDLVASNNGAGYSVAAWDFNKDGKDELLVGQNGPLGMIQAVSLGAANATFGIVLDASYSPALDVFSALEGILGAFRGDQGVNLRVSDLNGDGTPQVIITSRGDSTGAAALKNWILIAQPVVTDGQVTALNVLGGGIQNAFTEPAGANPSNGLNIGVGEFSGFSSDGRALIVGSKAIVDYTGFTANVSMAPTASLYTVLKVNFASDGSVSGTSNMLIPGRAEGFSAFQDNFEPASHEVTVTGYNINQ